jgi:type I restriction enzyme R subunit
VVTLDDPRLEKLYAYLSWLLKLLPDRDVPPDAVITDDMLDLKAFRIERKEEGSALPKPGDTAALTPIREFGAKPMTEDEAKQLSELVKTFNERHGTTFTQDDFDKLEKLNARIIAGNMGATLRNNPSDVSFRSYEEEFFTELVADFQRSDDFKNIVLADAEMRKQVIKYYHGRAVREA